MSEASATIGSRPQIGLRPIAVQCAAGECPTVYVSDRDTVVVQGYHLHPDEAGLSLPPGERLVEIPRSLLAQVARNLPDS